jgi:hypothetical protein
MNLTAFVKIELVVATNFELVWKDSILALGRVHNCYGYMNAYENVLKSLNFTDLMASCGLLIAFGWMISVVKVFIEFSRGTDLPSRLVNDAGAASFKTAASVVCLIFSRLAFNLIWAASNMSIFWAYVLSENSAPFSSMPHLPCIPTIGSLRPQVLQFLHE